VWIAIGVLLAAGIGGGLGMLAFRMTAPAPIPLAAAPPPPTTAAPETKPAEPVTTSTAAAAATTAAPAPTPIRVTTDPPGASVRDETMELCTSTPCDLLFKGEAADPSRTHKLTIAKPGYRFEARTVKASDGPVHVKLTRFAAAGAARPQGGSPASKPTGESNTVQPGFKDIPY
jgi:serine/threonine-protein kinase